MRLNENWRLLGFKRPNPLFEHTGLFTENFFRLRTLQICFFFKFFLSLERICFNAIELSMTVAGFIILFFKRKETWTFDEKFLNRPFSVAGFCISSLSGLWPPFATSLYIVALEMAVCVVMIYSWHFNRANRFEIFLKLQCSVTYT